MKQCLFFVRVYFITGSTVKPALPLPVGLTVSCIKQIFVWKIIRCTSFIKSEGNVRDVLWKWTDSDWLASAPNTRTLFNDATLQWLHLLGEITQTVKRHFFFFCHVSLRTFVLLVRSRLFFLARQL